MIGVGQNADGVVFHTVVTGFGNERFANPYHFLAPLRSGHGVEQIVEDDFVAGELLQSLPEHGLGPVWVRFAEFAGFPTDFFHFFLRFQPVIVKKLVGGHPEEGCQCRNEGHIRHGSAVLPFADGLEGHAQILRQYFLRNTSFFAEFPDFCP